MVVAAAVATAVAGAAVVASRNAPPPVGDVVLFRNRPDIPVTLQYEEGFATALDALGYGGRSIDVGGDTNPTEALAAGPDVVIDAAVDFDLAAAAEAHPSVRFVSVDEMVDQANVTSLIVNTHEVSYLAGAAAALTSQTGTIGFIGGADEELIWEFAAGYAAGARAVDPGIRVLTEYLARPPNWIEGFANPAAGQVAARAQYEQSADVVFAPAGSSGLGVFQAAVDVTAETGTFRWAIGVDTDQYHTVIDMPLSIDARPWQPHILTSVLKLSDLVVRDAVITFADGQLMPGIVHVGLAESAVDISFRGGFLDPVRPTLDALRQGIVDGSIDVPCRPANRAGRTTPAPAPPLRVMLTSLSRGGVVPVETHTSGQK